MRLPSQQSVWWFAWRGLSLSEPLVAAWDQLRSRAWGDRIDVPSMSDAWLQVFDIERAKRGDDR